MDEELPEGAMVLCGTTATEYFRPALPGAVMGHRVRLLRV